MSCSVTREQLWSWIDRDAPELDRHLAECGHCRAQAIDIRRKIDVVAAGAGPSRPVPETIGPYVILRFLGEGGQAFVYEALQPLLKRKVALKVLKGGRFAGEKAVRRFQREARALGQLQHPNIAAVYEGGQTELGLHYLAMELVSGTPWGEHVRTRRLGLREKLDLFQRVCQAVDFAHRRGVIHRDLKPSNVLVQEDGSPKILDFGLAKLMQREFGTTVTATVAASGEGTPRYMSPEQATGRPEDIDARTDVYSLGVMLYEMLTGQPPYELSELSPLALQRIRHTPPQRPSVLDPGIDDKLEIILLKALEKEPGARYSTVGAFAEDIGHYLHARPIRARRRSRILAAGRRLQRWRRWPMAAALVTVVVVALGAWWSLRPTTDVVPIRLQMLEIRRDLFRLGKDPVLLSRVQEVANLHSSMPEARLLFAHGQVVRGLPHIAAVWLRANLENDPSLWPLEAMRKEIESIRQGVEPKASAVPFPDTAEGWYLRSFASIDAHRALEYAREAVDRAPHDEMALAAMAYFSQAVGHDDEALQWASRLIEVSGHVPRWYLYKSQILFGLGRYQEALAQQDRMVALSPRDWSVRGARARLARRLKMYDLAVADLTVAIELAGENHPTSAWHLFHRGSAQWMNGDPEAAAHDYQKAYELLDYPTFANARLYIVLNDLGRTDEAAVSLGAARHRVWDDPWLARIFECLSGEITPQQLIDLAASDKQLCEALYYAAEMYRLQGRLDQAIETFRRCDELGVESDPDLVMDTMTEHELAEWRLEQLLSREDDDAL